MQMTIQSASFPATGMANSATVLVLSLAPLGCSCESVSEKFKWYLLICYAESCTIRLELYLDFGVALGAVTARPDENPCFQRPRSCKSMARAISSRSYPGAEYNMITDYWPTYERSFATQSQLCI